MSLVRQSLSAAAAAVVMSVSRILLMSALARRMPHEAFGQLAYAQWLVDMGVLVCSLGATASASRFLAEFSGNPPAAAAFLRRWARYAVFTPLAGAVAAILGARG